MVKEEIIKKAKELGFKVGYYAHDEFASWVWRERKALTEQAEKHGISKEVAEAYEYGKLLGQKRRALDERKKKEKKIALKERKEVTIKLKIEEERKSVERTFSDNVITSAASEFKAIRKPKMISQPKLLGLPRLLKRFLSLE